MTRLALRLLFVFGFFLGLGLALLPRAPLLGLAMIAPNVLFILNTAVFLVIDYCTKGRHA